MVSQGFSSPVCVLNACLAQAYNNNLNYPLKLMITIIKTPMSYIYISNYTNRISVNFESHSRVGGGGGGGGGGRFISPNTGPICMKTRSSCILYSWWSWENCLSYDLDHLEQSSPNEFFMSALRSHNNFHNSIV